MRCILLFITVILTPFLLVGQEQQHIIKPYRIGIVVTDLDKSKSWYKDVFDVSLHKEISYPEFGMRVSLLKADHVQFELVSREAYYRPEEIIKDYDYREKPIIGLYKHSYEVNDIELFYEKLKKKGIPIFFDLGTDEDLKIKAFHIKDPDGNALQFVEEIE